MLVAGSSLWGQSAVGASYRKSSQSIDELKPYQKVSRPGAAFDKLSNSLRRKLLDVTVDPRPRLSRELLGVQQLLSYTSEALQELGSYVASMKELAAVYYGQGYTDEERADAREIFDLTKGEALKLIDNAIVYDKSVLKDSGAPLFSQKVGPLSYEVDFTIEFDAGDYADIASLDITAGESVVTDLIAAEGAKVERFAARLDGYVQGVGSQVEMIVNSTQFYNGNEDILTEREASQIAELSKRWVNEDSARFFGSSNVPPRNRILDLFTFESSSNKKDDREKDTS